MGAPKGHPCYNKKGQEGGRPREWTPARIEKERQYLLKWIANPKNFSVISFLNARDICRAQLERICNYSETFRATYEKAKQIQEERLIELAVTKKGDSNFIKFMLQNKAGWKERSEISGDKQNPLAMIMQHVAKNYKEPVIDYEENNSVDYSKDHKSLEHKN